VLKTIDRPHRLWRRKELLKKFMEDEKKANSVTGKKRAVEYAAREVGGV